MRASTNILTGSTESTVSQDVQDYQSAVALHVGGDWGQHTQLRLYATPYAEPISGHTIQNATLLRVQLSGIQDDGWGDGVFTLPAIDPAIVTNPGGPPIIIQQPADTSAILGAAAGFRVSVISSVTTTYQWYKDGVAVAGATGAVYIIPSAVTGGSFTVTATNVYGTVTSNAAILTILPIPPGFKKSSGGDFNFAALIDPIGFSLFGG